MGTPDLFVKAFALLAFLTAFYALVARERKTPYITNTLYSTLNLIVLSLLLWQLSGLFPTRPRASLWFRWSGNVLFTVCVFVAWVNLWKLRNRHLHLRVDNLFRSTFLFRKAKSLGRSIRHTRTYEHHPQRFSDELVTAISENPQLDRHRIESALKRSLNGRLSPSIYAGVLCLADADVFLLSLAKAFLSTNCYVQYSTCARHPLELVLQLEAGAGDDWSKISEHIVVVDAYTPHFGFTDSNFAEATKKLSTLGVKSVPASPTYAGLHTATARAFNITKKRTKKNSQARFPALVIYEGCFSLADLESVEQYRIFMRHVLPSERLWGSMLTVVIEGPLPEDSKSVLATYADITISLAPQG